MVHEFSRPPAARFAGGVGIAAKESVSRPAAALRPRGALRVSFHRRGHTPRDRGMVAARAQRTVLPGNLFAAKLTTAELVGIQQPWFAMQHWELSNPNAGSGTYLLSGWLFLRLIGLIYFTAFVSLAMQIKGLVGSRGILPARDFLLANQSWGSARFLQIPTLCWWNASDAFLQFLCQGGAALSLLLVVGIAPIPLLILLCIFYLSLFSVCRIFLSYQWEIGRASCRERV